MANINQTGAKKIRHLFLPPGPRPVAEPEKELRFTRGAQAIVFYVLASLTACTGIALMILSTQDWGMDQPPLKAWWWLIIPNTLIGIWFLRLGIRCSRHAYIILTPLGVEIFPFFKPGKNLRVIYWTEVHDAEVRDSQLILHLSEQKERGVIASLQPIPSRQRDLLRTAMKGMMGKRQTSSP